jgi:acylglycerol lipase
MSQGLANTVQEGTFESVGLYIFYRAWRPTGRPRGVVVIVPGFNSHSAYYGWAEQFVASGLAAYSLDLRACVLQIMARMDARRRSSGRRLS